LLVSTSNFWWVNGKGIVDQTCKRKHAARNGTTAGGEGLALQSLGDRYTLAALRDRAPRRHYARRTDSRQLGAYIAADATDVNAPVYCTLTVKTMRAAQSTQRAALFDAIVDGP